MFNENEAIKDEKKKFPRPTLHQVSGLVRLERIFPPREGKYPIALLTVRTGKGFFSQVKALGKLAEKLAQEGVSPGTFLYVTGHLSPGDKEPWLMLRWGVPLSPPSPSPYASIKPAELRTEEISSWDQANSATPRKESPSSRGFLGLEEGASALASSPPSRGRARPGWTSRPLPFR